VRAFSGALTAADDQLALGDTIVVPLQVRALALCGLAVATGDPAWAADAASAFTSARNATSAVGVAADTRRLLKLIAPHDHTGILAEVGIPHEH
jgi:hypothetical protein